MAGDLHNHSTCSDGSVPIHRLAVMAARAGLDTMAVSDHDTLLSAEYCYRHPVQDGVRLIPATELTGYDYERKHRVHLLCYWPQDCPELRAHCDTMRRRRNECCLQSARELEALYPQFRTEQALEYAKDSGVLFKSGIMQALHELGLADSIYGEVYHYLFGWEPRGIVLHSPEYPPVEEVIATARAAKAVLVFAHPHRLQEYAAGAAARGGGQAGRHRDRPPPQQRGRQGRVPRPVPAVRPDRDRRHRLPRLEHRPPPPGGHLHHRGRSDRADQRAGKAVSEVILALSVTVRLRVLCHLSRTRERQEATGRSVALPYHSRCRV